jgi:hypothetical protein
MFSKFDNLGLATQEKYGDAIHWLQREKGHMSQNALWLPGETLCPIILKKKFLPTSFFRIFDFPSLPFFLAKGYQ